MDRALQFIAFIVGITALFSLPCAFVGTERYQEVLAYSALSIATRPTCLLRWGDRGPDVAATFHLLMHAFFNALLVPRVRESV